MRARFPLYCVKRDVAKAKQELYYRYVLSEILVSKVFLHTNNCFFLSSVFFIDCCLLYRFYFIDFIFRTSFRLWCTMYMTKTS